MPVSDPLGGPFYAEPTDDALQSAIEQWDHLEDRIDPRALQAHAAKFSEAEFARKMYPLLFG